MGCGLSSWVINEFSFNRWFFNICSVLNNFTYMFGWNKFKYNFLISILRIFFVGASVNSFENFVCNSIASVLLFDVIGNRVKLNWNFVHLWNYCLSTMLIQKLFTFGLILKIGLQLPLPDNYRFFHVLRLPVPFVFHKNKKTFFYVLF